MLECVVNVSEGRDEAVLAALVAAGGGALLDVHRDAHHHRAVLTLAGPDVEETVRAVADEALARIDLRHHSGAHPRLGAVDVVPFVPLAGSALDDAVAARDRFARWFGDERGVPCFVYGPERTLPEVRRGAFGALAPATGPPSAHPRAGATAVGARPVLVAYNLWLKAGVTVEQARSAAAAVRSPQVRALGFDLGGRVQVSCNLVEPEAVHPGDIHDRVSALVAVERAELVGLLPAGVLARIEERRWAELDVGPSRTIEARLQAAGLDGESGASAGRGER